MTDKPTASCATCHFYRGECIRFPPLPVHVSGGGVVNLRPKVQPNDVCGEHKPRGAR